MKRERGGATLAAVMALMLLGTLLLHGLGQLFELRMPTVAAEMRRIRATAQAHNALAWSTTQSWEVDAQWQCRQADGGGNVCLRLLDSSLLLLARDENALLHFWQRAVMRDGKVVFIPRSWSDFCPLAAGQACVP